ncbi:MAG TPA: OmpA family protein [Firmicutes bacterium]|nr:OmpA family protein [Bacillota bacterium]
MKVLKTLVIALVLTLLYGMLAQAAEPSLSLDLMYGEGELKEWNFAETDVTGALLSLSYPVNSFRFGAELGFAKEDLPEDEANFFFGKLKAGYALLAGANWEFVPYLGYQTVDAVDVIDAAGAMLGADFIWQMSPKFSLNLGAGYAIDPSVKLADYSLSDDSLWDMGLKLNYHFNNNWAMGAGYRQLNISGGGMDFDYDLFTLGVTYTWSCGEKTPADTGTETVDQSQPAAVPAEEPELEQPAVELEEQETPEPTPVEEQAQEEPAAEPEQPVEQPVNEPEEEPGPEVTAEDISRLLRPIFFKFDSAEIRKDQKPVLDQNIQVVKGHPQFYILVCGHACPPGTKAYNLRLSERRARKVAEYLAAKGIDAKMIFIRAYGEEETDHHLKWQGPDWESERWVIIELYEEQPTDQQYKAE